MKVEHMKESGHSFDSFVCHIHCQVFHSNHAAEAGALLYIHHRQRKWSIDCEEHLTATTAFPFGTRLNCVPYPLESSVCKRLVRIGHNHLTIISLCLHLVLSCMRRICCVSDDSKRWIRIISSKFTYHLSALQQKNSSICLLHSVCTIVSAISHEISSVIVWTSESYSFRWYDVCSWINRCLYTHILILIYSCCFIEFHAGSLPFI